MRMVKLLIFGFAGLFVIVIGSNAFRACSNSGSPRYTARTATPAQPMPQGQSGLPATPQPIQPLLQPGQALPQAGQGSAIAPREIQPVIIEAGKTELIKGMAALEVYNVDCGMDDNLPVEPVYKGTWRDFDTKKINYQKKVKKGMFSACTLGNFNFFYKAPADGFYTFGVNQYGKDAGLSWRVNGVLLFPIKFWDVGTETVRLKKDGYYDMDVRVWDKGGNGGSVAGMTLMVKAPGENEMHILTKDEIYQGRTVEAVAAPAKGGK